MSTTQDNGALAIRNSIAQVESALSELDKVSAGLADLAERHPVDLVFDVTSAKGMREAVAHRAAWRDPRLATERARKAAKAPILALGRDIDARAAWITEQLLLGEEPVDAQIKLEQERQETIRREEALKESARITAIQEALADIHMEAMSVIGKHSSIIEAKMDEMASRALEPAVFQESMGQAAAAMKSAIEKLTMAHAAAKHNEAEAALVAAERAELEQLRAAAKAQQEKDEAARLEAERERIRTEERAKAEADRVARDALDSRFAAFERLSVDEMKEATEPTVYHLRSYPADKPVAPLVSEPATINLGAINAWLGFTLTASFVADTLGIPPAETVKAAKMYRQSDVARICAALVTHIQAVYEKQAGEAA